jgi:hypothetical protein
VTLKVFLMIALGFGAARYVESLFYQVKATDADMIASPTCAILLTALVATLPAVLRCVQTPPRFCALSDERVLLITNL